MSHPLNTKSPENIKPIAVKPNLKYSHVTNTDSYKMPHWRQYPEDTEYMMSYMEGRGGKFEESTLFGLQPLLHMYLAHDGVKQLPTRKGHYCFSERWVEKAP